MTQKKVNMSIVDGKLFFSDEATVIHNPVKFFIDFKNNSPRIDVRYNQMQPMVVEHNCVGMDPYTAKQLLSALEDNIKKYEAQFGEIKKPEQIVQSEAKLKKVPDQNTVSATPPPSYLG